jgi:tetratricopeptide (TPR) repeat protein
MIVRNEEELLPGCLESVKDVVDELIIVDTGSTDNTIAIARSYGARVIEIEWRDDFAAARNVGLSAARGTWVLFMDADERFVGQRRAVRRALGKPDIIGYNVPIHNELEDGREDLHSNVRLFRKLPGVTFERRLHEQVLPSLLRATANGRIDIAPFYLRHLGYSTQAVERKGKRQRNFALAAAEVAAHPDDPFAAYNMGVEYMAAGRYEDGIAELRRARAQLSQHHPWQARYYKLEAQGLMQLGLFDEAFTLIAQAVLWWPDFTDLHFLRGIILQHHADWAGAEKAFRQCLRLGPAPTPPYDGADSMFGGGDAERLLGSILALQGRYSPARKHLLNVVKAHPGYMPAVQSLVECAIVAGDDLDELGRNPPPDPTEVGAALFVLGRYAHAVRAFERAEAIYPNLPVDHYLTKALAYLRMRDDGSASAAVADVRAESHRSQRAYVLDLIDWAQGRTSIDALKASYPTDHPIWRDVEKPGGEPATEQTGT